MQPKIFINYRRQKTSRPSPRLMSFGSKAEKGETTTIHLEDVTDLRRTKDCNWRQYHPSSLNLASRTWGFTWGLQRQIYSKEFFWDFVWPTCSVSWNLRTCVGFNCNWSLQDNVFASRGNCNARLHAHCLFTYYIVYCISHLLNIYFTFKWIM